MSWINLEELVSELETQVGELELSVQTLQDRYDIANVMGKYNYLHSSEFDKQLVDELWAKNAPDVSSERSNDGYFVSLPGIKKFHYECDNGGTPRKGGLLVSCNNTPVIEVAEDGRTAKGVWQGIGPEGGGIPFSMPTGAPEKASPELDADDLETPGFILCKTEFGPAMADWMLMKYGMDFIKENGEWKIWHLHTFEYFRCPFDYNWVDYSIHRYSSDTFALSRHAPSDYPPRFHYCYQPDNEPVLAPVPPKPYRTYFETYPYFYRYKGLI